MKRTAAAATIVALLSACATTAQPAPLTITTYGSETACVFEHAGEKITADELLVKARAAARSDGRGTVAPVPDDAPWRCLASAIYTMQLGGLREVEVVPLVAEPPTAP